MALKHLAKYSSAQMVQCHLSIAALFLLAVCIQPREGYAAEELDVSKKTVEFGRIFDFQRRTQTVHVVNSTSHAFYISSTYVDCGCVQLVVTNSFFPPMVSLPVSIVLTPPTTGSIKRFARIFTNARRDPQFFITADIASSIAIQPTVIDCGEMKMGESFRTNVVVRNISRKPWNPSVPNAPTGVSVKVGLQTAEIVELWVTCSPETFLGGKVETNVLHFASGLAPGHVVPIKLLGYRRTNVRFSRDEINLGFMHQGKPTMVSVTVKHKTMAGRFQVRKSTPSHPSLKSRVWPAGGDTFNMEVSFDGNLLSTNSHFVAHVVLDTNDTEDPNPVIKVIGFAVGQKSEPAVLRQ